MITFLHTVGRAFIAAIAKARNLDSEIIRFSTPLHHLDALFFDLTSRLSALLPAAIAAPRAIQPPDLATLITLARAGEDAVLRAAGEVTGSRFRNVNARAVGVRYQTNPQFGQSQRDNLAVMRAVMEQERLQRQDRAREKVAEVAGKKGGRKLLHEGSGGGGGSEQRWQTVGGRSDVPRQADQDQSVGETSSMVRQGGERNQHPAFPAPELEEDLLQDQAMLSGWQQVHGKHNRQQQPQDEQQHDPQQQQHDPQPQQHDLQQQQQQQRDQHQDDLESEQQQQQRVTEFVHAGQDAGGRGRGLQLTSAEQAGVQKRLVWRQTEGLYLAFDTALAASRQEGTVGRDGRKLPPDSQPHCGF